jgi:hypothetical protein
MRGVKNGDDIWEEVDVAANNRPFREEDEPAWYSVKWLAPLL